MSGSSNADKGNANHLALLEEELRVLKDLLGVAQVVVSSLDLDEVLQNILFSAMGVMDMPAGSIALYQDDPDGEANLELHAHAGLSQAFTDNARWQVKVGGLTHRILEEGELFIIEETVGAPFFNNPLALAEGIRSLIAVPLKIQEKMVGILYLNDFAPRTFPEGRLRMLSVLASFASMSIDNARLHEQTRYLACTDGLTGLYNHRQFMHMLQVQLNRAQRFQEPLTLLMFDVDNFKKFNDAYGHPTGDKALIAVGNALRKCLRSFDFCFRYGGEEFVAILPETDLSQALIAAERTRAAIAEESERALAGVVPHGVTVSVGVAVYPRDGEGEQLLEVVDQLLYQAKASGKNQVFHRVEAK